MKYELSAEVIKILDDLGKRFGVAIDWADKNVMPYLMDLYERFITYKIVVNAVPTIIFIICIIGVIVLTVKYFKCKNLAKETGKDNWAIDVHYTYANYYKYEATELFGGIAFVVGLLSLIDGLFVIFTIGTLLELIFIPEVYMINYLTNLM